MPEFSELGLSQPLLKALSDAQYERPTAIQSQAIGPILEGRDLLGIAQTGTGKTAAFALPMLDRLAAHSAKAPRGRMRALILAPTRELCSQIEDSFRKYGRHHRMSSAVIFGGVGQFSQVQALERGLDVLVATPGRLLDLMEQRHASLDKVEIFVLDEADRMLDMGFIVPIRRVVSALPQKRQTLLFSATMPGPIAELAHQLLHNPVRVEVTPVASTVEKVDQKVHFVDKSRKRDLLRLLLEDQSIYQALVFTRTKRGADKVADDLQRYKIGAAAIHGNKSQNNRERALGAFRSGELRVLVATDIAARGLDVPGVSLVVNYELPDEPESYVHRIGRTARAGREGRAVALCDPSERPLLRDIERLIRTHIPVDESQPYHASVPPPPLPSNFPRPQSVRNQARPQGPHSAPQSTRNPGLRRPEQSSGRLEGQTAGHQGQQRQEGQGGAPRRRRRGGRNRRRGPGGQPRPEGQQPPAQGGGFFSSLKKKFGLG